mmetsp:Transcript_27808/g.41234  ORF Transcript_27808/g.41234 Transcript_27808/m.41234 type:complete len:369 (-) Transcript_27808:56-1162(-)
MAPLLLSKSQGFKVRHYSERGGLHHSKKLPGLAIVLLGLAMLAGLVSVDWQRIDRPVPMKSFPLTYRELSRMEENLHAYNNETPLGFGSARTSMLLGIFSTNGAKYRNRREYIRDTYVGIDDPRICKLSEYIRQVEDNPLTAICQVPYTFIIAAGGSDRPYDHDDSEPLTVDTDTLSDVDSEGDCTYLNIRESMEDGKSTSFFKFGASIGKKYNIDYITKLDDDTLVNPLLLFQFIEDELPPAPFNRRIYGGRGWMTRSKNIMYGAGQLYFMSTDVAHYVGHTLTAEDRKNMSHDRKTEDADMGVFVFSNPGPIKFMNLALNQWWIHHETKTEDQFRRAWDKRGGLPLHERSIVWDHFCKYWSLNIGM